MVPTRIDPIRVLIVDDQVLFREGMAHILSPADDIEVVGKAEDGAQAAELAAEVAPDVVLMDVDMPNVGGIEATLRVRQVSPSTKVLMLTASEDEDDLYGALRAGAIGYLLKAMEPEVVAGAIREAMEGHSTLSPTMAAKLINEFNALASGAKADNGRQRSLLSQREMEVLSLIASEGLTNKAIAQRLHVSESTVKNHVTNTLAKLHLSTRMEAVLYAYRQGLVQGPQ